MTTDRCEGEWVLLGRRGTLSDFERRLLEDHLKSCQLCRMSQALGTAFDEPTDIQSGDDQRLERMMHAAERWLEHPRSLSRRNRTARSRYAVFLIAAIAITASAAAAAVAIRAHSEVAPLEAQHSQSTFVSSLPHGSRDKASREATAPEVALPVPRQVPAQDPVVQSPLSKRSTSSIQSVAPSSAEQLLRDAGLARRTGQLSEAGRLYQKLQQLYPASRESGLSRVSYGSLLLEQGKAATALEQFNRYLELGVRQGLAAEALYGKARALSALGRTSAERTAWLLLLKEFPKSPYSAQARKRIAQVE